MMIKVTSSNRNMARKLLTAYHPAVEVRQWPLSGLNLALQRLVNEGLMTVAGINRALSLDETPTARRSNSDGQANPADDGSSEAGEAETDAGSAGASAADDSDDDSEAEDSDSEAGDGSDDGTAGDSEGDDDAEGDADDKSDADEDDSWPEDFPYSNPESEPRPEACRDAIKLLTKIWAVREAVQTLGLKHVVSTRMIHHAITSRSNGILLSRIDSDIIFAGLTDAQIAQVKAQMKSQKPQEIPTEKFNGRHEIFDVILAYAKAGLPVAMIGPAGTGKSTLTEGLAKELGCEWRGTGAVMSKYDLIGFVDAGGTYHRTPLVDAYDNGGVYCFDELDASVDSAVVAFNAISDRQKHYAFPDGMHNKHENFLPIACMNTFGNGPTAEYVGRFKQDAAAMSRYVKVYMDYDRRLELAIAEGSAE